MKVLFITSTRLGDAILSTGLLDYISREYPQSQITIACGPLPSAIFRNVPGLERLIPLKKQKRAGHWIALWKIVAGTRWDIVVDLRNSPVSRTVFAKKRFIHGRHIDSRLHKVEQNALVMKLSEVPAPRLWFSPEQKARACELIPSDGPVLAVGPTANWLAKTWPPGCFVEVIAELIKPDGVLPFARVAVFGAPGEEAQAKPVLEAIPDDLRIDLVGRTDPAMAGAALERCNLYIGNDSGLMHTAAAVNVPTVGLFGPSYPHLYRPWGDHCIYVRTPETFDELIDFEGYDPALAPCLMTSLEPEVVAGEIKRFWLN